MADEQKGKLRNGIFVAGSVFPDRIDWIVYAPADIHGRITANALAKKLGAFTGGGGGGRKDTAQAGGREPAKFDAAVDSIPSLVEELLNG